jgi:integrase
MICQRMISMIPGNPVEPLFFVPRGNGIVPLYKRTFLSHLRDMLARSGDTDSARFTCPSFRRGGASWAFANNVPGEMIQVFGDWASDCYKIYLDISMDKKCYFAEHIAAFI